MQTLTTPEWIPFVVLLVIIVVPHLISVVIQLDIWPYSHYPMYSYKKRLDDVGWFHVWLEKADGTRRRWIPSHIRFAREVNRAFTKLMRAQTAQTSTTESPQHLDLLLDIVERRVRDDHPSIADFDAFCELSIVYVTCPNVRAGDLRLHEQVRHRRSLLNRSGELDRRVSA
jgi:hypothetical protein